MDRSTMERKQGGSGRRGQELLPLIAHRWRTMRGKKRIEGRSFRKRVYGALGKKGQKERGEEKTDKILFNVLLGKKRNKHPWGYSRNLGEAKRCEKGVSGTHDVGIEFVKASHECGIRQQKGSNMQPN